ncbi:DUF1153 domain-containing protein [Cognatiyoonia sp.]|uniref:DUF1153 domain-containing protein n=1 Tax=Cognatiyoonia sp. TaxID=2211652 RepID=UPI003F69608C
MLTRADLQPFETSRWVASRKAAIMMAVTSGLIKRDEALERYELTVEEYTEWERAIAKHGVRALKTTALQRHRLL